MNRSFMWFCHSTQGMKGSLILKRGYQAPKLTRMTSCAVTGAKSENTLSHSVPL